MTCANAILARTAFQWFAPDCHGTVKVRVEDGRVYLTGHAGNAHRFPNVETALRHVPGVACTENAIVIGMQSSTTMATRSRARHGKAVPACMERATIPGRHNVEIAIACHGNEVPHRHGTAVWIASINGWGLLHAFRATASRRAAP